MKRNWRDDKIKWRKAEQVLDLQQQSRASQEEQIE